MKILKDKYKINKQKIRLDEFALFVKDQFFEVEVIILRVNGGCLDINWR